MKLGKTLGGAASRRIGLRTKLLFAFATVALLLAGVATMAFVQVTQLSQQYHDVLVRRTQILHLSGEAKAAIYQRMVALRGYMLDQDPSEKEALDAAKKQLDTALRTVAPLLTNARGKELHALMLQEATGFYQIQDAALQNWNQGQRDAAVANLSAGSRLAAELADTAGRFSTLQFQLATADEQRLQRVTTTLRWVLAGSAGGALLLAVILALLLSGRIARSLTQVSQIAEAVSNGDLTVPLLRADAGDEIGDLARSVNRMVENLRGLLTTLAGQARTVMAAAEDLSAASEQAAQAASGAAQAIGQVAGGASQEAVDAAQTNGAMQQLENSIRQIAAGANRSAAEVGGASTLLEQMATALKEMTDGVTAVAAGAQQAAEIAHDGGLVVNRTVAGMGRIAEIVGESTRNIAELEEFTRKIDAIIGMISEIAEQTKLLALNAAIEAARAGEHGHGFAVVADEVGELARRSATSAKEIAALIRNIQTRTSAVAQTMKAGTGEVDASSKLAAEAGEALQSVMAAATQAAQGIQAIAQCAAGVHGDTRSVVRAFDILADTIQASNTATEEMAASTMQATSASDRMAGSATANAAAAQEVSAAVEELTASSEEVAAAAESLSGVARELRSQIHYFSLPADDQDGLHAG